LALLFRKEVDMSEQGKPALTVAKRIPAGKGLSQVLLRRASEVSLAWQARQARRFEAVDSAGRALRVELPEGDVLRGGDVLVAADGSLVRVAAAPEAVLVVTACAEHGRAVDLLRAAYHLGQRHVPLELRADRLLVEAEAALADQLRGEHLDVTEATSAFEPESGPYGAAGGGHGGHDHDHDHDHDHGHGHGHGHDHGHAHAGHDHGHAHAAHDHDHGHDHTQAAPARPASPGRRVAIPVVGQDAPHVHGPGCGHDHGPDPGHDHPPGHGHPKRGH
jgi:urease accessory protein